MPGPAAPLTHGIVPVARPAREARGGERSTALTFAAFLGASLRTTPSGWIGGMICLLAIFAPSFLLVVGALPFRERLRRSTRAQAALIGVNAAVVGLLLAALYQSS